MRDLQQSHGETQPLIVSRPTSTLPQTGQTSYFTVTGSIILVQIIGEVTSEIAGGENNIKLLSNPTVGADNDICDVLNIDADVVGTRYNITGDPTDALIETTAGAMQAQTSGVIVPAGKIDLDADASKGGETKWTLHYIPLETNSRVVIA